MKKVGVIMEELGFNKNSPDSVKEAFIRHLIKSVTGNEIPSRTKTIQSTSKVSDLEQQLSFAFEETNTSRKAI